VSTLGVKKIQNNSEKLDPIYLRNRYENLKNTTESYKSNGKGKKIKYYDISKEKGRSIKIRLVDLYNYDRKKWEEQNLPKQEKTLQNILVRKSTFSYLNEMLGEWGSKGKLKK
jgi:hypothetical protein